MRDAGLQIFEKSLEKSLIFRSDSITDPSRLELALFRISKWCLVGAVTALYLLAHQWNAFFAILMALLFAYSFAGLAHLLIDFIVYLFTNPLLLQEKREILQEGIPASVKVAFIRPIFAKSVPQMEIALLHMRQEIATHLGPSRQIKFILVDNTSEPGLRAYARERILELQDEFGSDAVFYFYRNPDCNFFKKAGIFQDLVMLLREGWTRPRHYTDAKWDPWTQGTRNPEKPIWGEILGDLRALGIQAGKEEILAGRDITLSETGKIEIAFLADADNLWPAGQPRKLVAKMLHPDNHPITIFQPCIELSNPNETRFIRLTAWARKMYGFDPIAKWRLYRFSPFYGKGAIRLASYAENIITNEVIHPGKAASHDFQESLYTASVLVEDVYILERTFSNKLSELIRGTQWLWGDMETVRQYLPQNFSPGRKEHLWMLLRVVIGPFVYALWLLGTILACLTSTVAHPALLGVIFFTIASGSILIPKFIVPYLDRFKEKGYQIGPAESEGNITPKPEIKKIILEGLWETILSTAIYSLDLIYRSWAVVANLYRQFTGKEFVWTTGASGEAETANISLKQTYKILWAAPATGALLLLATLSGFFPSGLGLIVAPYTLSFLLGPLAVWYTSNPLTNQ